MSKNTQKRKSVDDGNDDRDEVEDLDISDEEGGVRIDDIYIPPPPKTVSGTEADGSRLIITKIVNNFFKSYAEREVVGPFHKCFNAIVGPNGSGKSNVIDSLLFVFGYRASKIRSKKISVLLHNSENFQNVQSCTVEIHFATIIDKEGDAYDVIPGGEFVISRTANKDNSSFYQLNGHRVQFKEIALLLRKHGIDLDHNRFLILQGEVEQIAMMKCKAQNEHETGLLEYLEDIIGTSRFKKPLVQLENKLEVLAEQRTEKLNRLKLVEKELDELKQPMDEAVGFLKLENSIANNKNRLYQKNIQIVELQLEELNSQKEEVQTVHNEIINKLNEFESKKLEKENELKERSKKYENLEKRRDTLKEAFDRANNKDIQLQADMTHLNKDRKKTKELLSEERKKLADYERIPEQNQQTIQECEAREIDLNAKKEKLEEEKLRILASLRAETQELQDQKEVLETELAELNKIVGEAKEPYALAESELKLYLSNEENERKKLDMLKEKYEKADEIIQDRTRAITELRKKIPQTEKSLQNAINEFNKIKALEATIAGDLRSKRAQVEESKFSMQASRSRGRVLDSLMQQKREGNCPGLFGRLGDLGAIDLKYDVAISTACGPLDNIVVDTVSTAQWCIEFLKRNDIGRATFIALDKQEHWRNRANTLINTPENVPRLYDLVQVQDERVKTAFYYALRDTLVANDLDQASRIAYGAQRYRVVTLKGDLIETTGTMSGGGKRVSRGRMGQSVVANIVDPKQIEKMEIEVRNQEQELNELQQKQLSLEDQINTLQPELRQMQVNLEKFNLELKSLQQQQPNLAQQLKKQEAKLKMCKADPAQVEKLTNIVNKRKVEYDMAMDSAKKVKVQVDKLTEEIKDKTVNKVKAVDKKLKEVTGTIDKCKNEITRLKVATKTAVRNAKKSAEKISNMEQDIINAENRLKTMKAEREEIEADAAKLLTCIGEITEQLEDGQEEFAALKKEVAEVLKSVNKIKAEKIDVDQKMKTFVKAINDCKDQIKGWKHRLQGLELQKIPNETVEELKTLSAEELNSIDVERIKRDLHVQEKEIKGMKPNLNIIEEYCKAQGVLVERTKQLDAITEKKTQMRDMLEQVKNKRKEEFLRGYNIIKMKLKEMYQMITLGGDADFEMVDTFDPFSEGIQFNVRPPKKSWKMISNLSGGEKTLSSLALVFALHYYKPSPLYVMDEIDAALDFKNVSIVGNYIKERTKNAQFIVISLRSDMFELCNHLIGIYKTFNCTHSLTIDPRVYDKKKSQEHVGEEAGNNATENLQDNQEIEQATENRNVENESGIAGTHSRDSSSESLPTQVEETVNDSFEDMEVNA